MNIQKLQDLYFDFYRWGKRKLVARGTRNKAIKYLNNKEILTSEEKKQAIAFWKPYGKIDLVYHAFFKEKTGVFHPEWLPQDVYYNCIDEYFNDRDASQVLDDKSLYSRLFQGVPQIASVVSRMGGLWYDTDLNLITEEKVREIISEEEALFIKVATQSCGGKGVQYVSGEMIADQFTKAVKGLSGNIVVQKPFRQHKTYAALNASSVNTLRIISLLTEEGVKIYSGVVRMGVDNAKVDNATVGGIFCGIRDDQTLGKTAYRLTGESFTVHPNSGIVFDGYQIVGYDKAKALIEKAHPLVPAFRMVSWDIAIDEQGEAVMMEANLAKGCLTFHQLTKGPLFGDDTKKVLDEVFGIKR